MRLSAISDGDAADSFSARPVKRAKTTVVSSERVHSSTEELDKRIHPGAEELNESTLLGRHPLGVRPLGNGLNSHANARNFSGIYARLPDELLVQLLEWLDARDLLRLGGACRALHAFTRNDELWRTLFIDSPPQHFTWRGTWRTTWLSQSPSLEPVVDCSALFSDVLYRPFMCAHISLHAYADNIPPQNEIARLPNITYGEFSTGWCNQPFILSDPVKQWPICKTWSVERLLANYGTVAFRAEAIDWPLNRYVEYMGNSQDESPLYLFDHAFVEKMQLRVSADAHDSADYWPPVCYGSDAFSCLGKQRPDHRWLIIGPERSGSTFHKDPNATSAWNAVVQGSKYWVMFPSSPSRPPPPGVYVSADQSEVTSPLSIVEWLLAFHTEARLTPGCKEGICRAGEVLYVPSGWYHLVLNLETSIAITHNFVPRSKVGAVLQFLRDQKQSISGFSSEVDDPYSLFVERLRAEDGDLLKEGLQELGRLDRVGRGWEELTKTSADEVQQGGFSFGFGNGGEVDNVEEGGASVAKREGKAAMI